MNGTHVVLDHVFIAAIILFSVIEWRWLWPRCIRAIASDVPGARARIYYRIVVGEWLFTACVIAAWKIQGRSWAGLMLGQTSPLRLGAGLAFAATIVGLLWLQRRAIFARPDRIEEVRQRLGFADPLLPHTPAEHRIFIVVSVTAGICEEILFRGFVMWYFTVWTGPVPAVVASSLIFGFGHIYLSLAHVPRTALVGVIFALLVLATGSLWPVIIIHAALDLNSGGIAFRIRQRASLGGSEPGRHAQI